MISFPAPTCPELFDASELLSEAAEIVAGNRPSIHGPRERSFTAIAAMWTAYIDQRTAAGPIRAYDVAQMMVLLKMCRAEHGKPVRDHAVDQAGYSAIAGELAQ